uniref:Uncharacterized protein n=1 Tax=Avena sativa TaxID=4498 RepID=A0ACD5ZS69_AVESA
MEICTTTPSSPPPVDVVVLSDTDSDDDDDDDSTLSRPAAERVTSSLCTQAEVDALCQKHGVPREFAARPAGDRRACTPPRPGAVCVYAHALEAGMRFPLHPFFSDALSHFGLAPGQLTPNGWRVLLGFVVLCHSAAVPPSVAVFRHFFSLPSRKGWYGFKCKKGAGVLFTGLTSAKSEKDWKRGFFFLTSPEPWLCPVRWGQPPSTISAASPALSSEDKKSVAKLVHLHSSSVDLRTYLSETNLAAVFSSNFAGASPPPPPQPSSRSTGSEGMDLIADEAVAPAGKVKAEPDGDTPQFFSRKKRKLEDVAGAKDGLGRSELNAPPGWRAPPGPDASPRHSPVPDTHDGDSADWEESRKVLECIVTPARERAFAVAKPSDIVMSTYVAIHQVVNYTSFSLRYALELQEKQASHEREVAALREQLEEAKAEMAAAKQAAEAKLEKARRATEAEVESAKATAVQQFLGSKEYTRRVAEQALAAYEDGAEEMKRVALRVNPRLDAAKLVLSP